MFYTVIIELASMYLKDQMQWKWYSEKKEHIYLTVVPQINKYLLSVRMKNNK